MLTSLYGVATSSIRVLHSATALFCAKAQVGEARQLGLLCHAPCAGENEAPRETLAKLQTWGQRCINGSLTIAP